MADILHKPGLSKTLPQVMAEIQQKAVRIGWFEEAKEEDGTPCAYLAAIHEMGSPANGIPPRPFVRPTVAEKSANWNKQFSAGIKQAMNGAGSVQEVMDTIGQLAAGDIRRAISRVTAPALKQPTVDAKRRKMADGKKVGSLTKPLVETGTMLNTCTSKVENK